MIDTFLKKSAAECTLVRNNGGDPGNVLINVLNHVADKNVLLPMIKEIQQTRKFFNYSYYHNNGFYVFFLCDPDLGIQVRLHIWLPSAHQRIENPHRHRMGFASRIFAGELREIIYNRLPYTSTATAPDASTFYEVKIVAPTVDNFDVDHVEMNVVDTVLLGEQSRNSYRRGESYLFQAANIHQSDTSTALEPIVTLTVWEPPFQESLAFEPTHSFPADSKVAKVIRPDASSFDHAFGKAIDAIQEQYADR